MYHLCVEFITDHVRKVMFLIVFVCLFTTGSAIPGCNGIGREEALILLAKRINQEGDSSFRGKDQQEEGPFLTKRKEVSKETQLGRPWSVCIGMLMEEHLVCNGVIILISNVSVSVISS